MSKKIVFGNTADGELSFADEQIDERHIAIRGKTGERKTLFLLSLLIQFIRLVNHAIVYIDLGRDQAAFWILKEEAEKANKPFYFFSLGPHDGCSWDPLGNTPAFAADLNEAANGLATGMKLEHSDGYGRTFYSRLNVAALNSAFDALLAKGNTLPTFAELAKELHEQAAEQKGTSVSESALALDQILRFSAIKDKRVNELYLGKAIEEDAVVVFHLTPNPAAKAIATLAHWCTTIEASYRVATGMTKKTIHLGTDEFGVIAAGRSALSNSLVLSRKWGVRHYLTYQSSNQMKTADGDLNPIISSQCQMILFTTKDEEQDELRLESKDVLREQESRTEQDIGIKGSVTKRFELEPGLTRNEIMDVNAIAMEAFGVFKLGDKHRDPIRFTIIPPRSKTRHAELANKPLPALEHKTGAVNATLDEGQAAPRYDAKRPERIADLQKLLAQIQAEEAWTIGA